MKASAAGAELAIPSWCGVGFPSWPTAHAARAGSRAATSGAAGRRETSSCWAATSSTDGAAPRAAGTGTVALAEASTSTAVAARHSRAAAAAAVTAAVRRCCGAGRGPRVTRRKLASWTAAYDMTWAGRVWAFALLPSCRMCLRTTVSEMSRRVVTDRNGGRRKKMATHLRMCIR